jgi:polyribonucleotide nucleotidyltransferase
MMREVRPGEIFEEAEVKRMLPFGAFVEFLPGKEGMVHVSQMSSEYVKNPADVVNIGDKVKVRVIEIDEQGRINLSMKFGPDADKPSSGGGERSGDRGGFEDRGPRRDGGGFRGRGGSRGPRRDFAPRNEFAPRNDRGGDFEQAAPLKGPRHDDPNAGPSDHPLAMQFRREREENFRRNNPRSGGRRPFKKTHY